MVSRIRRNTKIILGVFAMVAALLYALTTSGVWDASGYWTATIGITLGLVIESEAAWRQYLNKSAYRNISIGDFVNFIAVMVGAAVIMQGILFIPIIANAVAQPVLDFFGRVGAFIGIAAGILTGVKLLMKD